MRKLKFIAWDMIQSASSKLETLGNTLEYLADLNFEIVPYTTLRTKFNEKTIELMKEVAGYYSYPIDGLVVKYDNIAEYQACGRTDHHFKGGMAFKFADEEYETWLNNIDWTMGRTGVLTPIACFEPVDTGDSVIEKASLHNVSIMKQLLGTPYQGQSLTVFKANDIIPQVSSAGCEISKADIAGLEFTIPTVCPICGGETKVVCEVDTEVLMCTNEACSGKLINRLEHFCSKKGMDIKGLSKATLEKLVEWNWIKEPSDLYNLNKRLQVWANKPGFGIKSVNNILNSIETSRTPKLESFICALGIPHVGKTLSKELVKYFNSYEEFRDAAQSGWDFTQIDGVAEEKASAIWNFDFAEADRVATYMLGYEVEQSGATAKNLEGESICITGRLTLFKNRNELVDEIEKRGGKVVSGVSRNTTWLINNDINSNSSKNVAAQRLNIPIITEIEFCNLYLAE
jgi:DNA ligase (NAD+)